MDLNRKEQDILEEQTYKVSCFIVTHDKTILYCLTEPNTKIYIHGKDEYLQTTHELGIIHLAVY
jgi:hypothetical protein